MLSIIRIVLVTLYCILACIFGCIYCLFSPRNPRHVATFGDMFGRLSPLFGLNVETRIPAVGKNFGNSIYIAIHQYNYVMVPISIAVLTNTVSVCK